MGQYHKLEFWDSKLSGKKKLALDSRIIVYNQYDDDFSFAYTFPIGYTTVNIVQIDEDKYDVLFDGYRFRDLLAQEKANKKSQQRKVEKEKKILNERKRKE